MLLSIPVSIWRLYPYELSLYRVGSIEIAVKKAKAAIFFDMDTGQNGRSVENNQQVAEVGVDVMDGLADLPSRPRRK
ncbi:MAG: hypothetical protein Q7U98_04015 [Methylicorpusculum sp.]|uniref:hypothetical protein n=1 Tax=Methylicorpusculum sp. TaxID=2713644 RepID=UPI00272422C2|nr:hypothetical protein [Methylicorpusculum sp.]MDO8938304.1 hypothetical protein [Methylicorpusculum sp.]MDP2200617.1 hypothetical protein [Methylicorpusculum sp.]